MECDLMVGYLGVALRDSEKGALSALMSLLHVLKVNRANQEAKSSEYTVLDVMFLSAGGVNVLRRWECS